MTKKKYQVGVSYSTYGYIIVEAENEKEAFNIANDQNNDYALGQILDPEYEVDSWAADPEAIWELPRK